MSQKITGTKGASPTKRKSTRKPARGGNSEKHRRISWRLLLNSFLLLSFLAVITWSIVRLEPLKIVKQYTNKPISTVSVQGDFKYVTQQHVEALVAQKLTKTFLELDIVALKSHLENNAWIDHAVVSRQWPDTLLIKILEQQPIARWNSTGFLNLRGEIVNLSNKTPLDHLPLLSADDRYAEQVMQQYVLVTKLLGSYKFAPLVLELDNTLAWSLTISPEITIKLGRDEVLEKLQRLMVVMTGSLSGDIPRIRTIDIRYKQGFAIGWLKAANNERREQELRHESRQERG